MVDLALAGIAKLGQLQREVLASAGVRLEELTLAPKG
jgi:hypothetical protein